MSGEFLLSHSYLIPLVPLAAFILILVLRPFLGSIVSWIGVLGMAYCFIHASLIASGIFSGSIQLPTEGLQGHFFESSMSWFSVGDFEFRLGLLIDGLSSVMLVVVTLVALLVQIYSTSYMHDHIRYPRYFAYVNLFTFSMLILVVANNMLQFFIGWELVGLCSYLLIGFDFERDAAAYAGRKAFLTTKFADLGMYVGLLIIFNYLGTFNIPSLHHNLEQIAYPRWVINIVPILLFCGAMGKSAQFPLHVWLPDAMEGPTPASALIHAATMVAAGVYMVARVYFFFEASPVSMEVVAWVGVATAVIAASMGLVSIDIKRVLAFSTVSQLGFMMVGLGCGGYSAGMFHLATHAAFKALLFLCAGSVIHAVHTNDMWKMGGLMKVMPITATTYLIATTAIAGFPPLAGFFSKEEILGAAFNHNPVIFGLLVFASFLTSFYMFRTWFLTFTGTPRDHERHHHAHESPLLMTVPLMVLAIPSLFLGFFFWYQGNLEKFISWGHGEVVESHGHQIVMALSLLAASSGLGLSFWIYKTKPSKDDMLAAKFAGLHQLITQRYKIDELYLWFIGKVYHPFSRWLADVDYNFVDQGIIDGFGRVGKGLAWVGDLVDFNVVDQIFIDGNGSLANRLSRVVKRLQSGLAQSYLFWMAFGVGVMFVWMAHHYK